jgi:hypothetical protein
MICLIFVVFCEKKEKRIDVVSGKIFGATKTDVFRKKTDFEIDLNRESIVNGVVIKINVMKLRF